MCEDVVTRPDSRRRRLVRVVLTGALAALLHLLGAGSRAQRRV